MSFDEPAMAGPPLMALTPQSPVWAQVDTVVTMLLWFSYFAFVLQHCLTPGFFTFIGGSPSLGRTSAIAYCSPWCENCAVKGHQNGQDKFSVCACSCWQHARTCASFSIATAEILCQGDFGKQSIGVLYPPSLLQQACACMLLPKACLM